MDFSTPRLCSHAPVRLPGVTWRSGCRRAGTCPRRQAHLARSRSWLCPWVFRPSILGPIRAGFALRYTNESNFGEVRFSAGNSLISKDKASIKTPQLRDQGSSSHRSYGGVWSGEIRFSVTNPAWPVGASARPQAGERARKPRRAEYPPAQVPARISSALQGSSRAGAR